MNKNEKSLEFSVTFVSNILSSQPDLLNSIQNFKNKDEPIQDVAIKHYYNLFKNILDANDN